MLPPMIASARCAIRFKWYLYVAAARYVTVGLPGYQEQVETILQTLIHLHSERPGFALNVRHWCSIALPTIVCASCAGFHI